MKNGKIGKMSYLMSTEDMKVFEELMKYKQTVFFICLGFAKNPFDAEELTQDVYLKAYGKIGTLKDRSLGRDWLFKIAKNRCVDFVRKSRFSSMFRLETEQEPVDLSTPETRAVENEQVQLLKEAIGRLPNKLRQVFLLREYGELSYREISAALEIKEGTVMSRLNRARRFIVNRIKEGNYEKQK